jgi:hypothetical protein
MEPKISLDCHIYNSGPLDHFTTQLNKAPKLVPYYLRSILILFLLLFLRLPNILFTSVFFTKMLCAFLFSRRGRYNSRPFHSSCFINYNIWWRMRIAKSPLFIFLQRSLIPFSWNEMVYLEPWSLPRPVYVRHSGWEKKCFKSALSNKGTKRNIVRIWRVLSPGT